MVDRRELITICRHIGNMMEAGVDILRITQVLRAQTDNQRLLQIYNQFDHDLRMGASIAEAMVRASDIFSPFMVSLVRQAEQRSDLESISSHVAAAFLKIADFVQQDEEEAREASHAVPVVEAVISPPLDIRSVADTANTWPLTLRAIESFTDRLQLIALRALTLLAGLLLSLAAVWYSVEMQWIERQWQNVVLCSVSALFIACAGVWVRRQIENEKRQSSQCSFCGQADSAEVPLRPIPGFPGAAICGSCAIAMAQPQTNGVDTAPESSTNQVTLASTSKPVSPVAPTIAPGTAMRANTNGPIQLLDEDELDKGTISNGRGNNSSPKSRSSSLNSPRSIKPVKERKQHNTPQPEGIEEADYE